MGTKRQSGFTIIEVTLFLAISGLLALLLLGGWTTMINSQRYKDSVKTVQSFIQQQYNLVYNVENGRSNDLVCSTTSTVDDGTEARGQSNCVIMGRYIELVDGQTFNVKTIVGQESSDDPSQTDTQTIKDRSPAKIEQDIGLTSSTQVIPWQARAVGVSNGSPSQNLSLAIAIVRSPSSGTVHTYTRQIDGTAFSLVDMIDTNYEKESVVMCLDAGVPLAGGKMGIVIKPYASAQSSIQTTNESDAAC